jgi:hypothetical protein
VSPTEFKQDSAKYSAVTDAPSARKDLSQQNTRVFSSEQFTLSISNQLDIYFLTF